MWLLFWAAVYRPFTSQKVTHADVQALVARGLEQTQGSYKGLYGCSICQAAITGDSCSS